MFSRTATSVCVLALPLLATATALPRGGKPPPSPPSSQCNTGSVQCCNSVQAVNLSLNWNSDCANALGLPNSLVLKALLVSSSGSWVLQSVVSLLTLVVSDNSQTFVYLDFIILWNSYLHPRYRHRQWQLLHSTDCLLHWQFIRKIFLMKTINVFFSKLL